MMGTLCMICLQRICVLQCKATARDVSTEQAKVVGKLLQVLVTLSKGYYGLHN